MDTWQYFSVRWFAHAFLMHAIFLVMCTYDVFKNASNYFFSSVIVTTGISKHENNRYTAEKDVPFFRQSWNRSTYLRDCC